MASFYDSISVPLAQLIDLFLPWYSSDNRNGRIYIATLGDRFLGL